MPSPAQHPKKPSWWCSCCAAQLGQAQPHPARAPRAPARAPHGPHPARAPQGPRPQPRQHRLSSAPASAVSALFLGPCLSPGSPRGFGVCLPGQCPPTAAPQAGGTAEPSAQLGHSSQHLPLCHFSTSCCARCSCQEAWARSSACRRDEGSRYQGSVVVHRWELQLCHLQVRGAAATSVTVGVPGESREAVAEHQWGWC